jgi:hypothetical protein
MQREMRNAYNIFIREPLRKGTFGRPRHGWEDSIKRELI